MSQNLKFICWTSLFAGILIPFILNLLKWSWIRISISKRFQPDFITPVKTLLFKSMRENVNYNSPGENLWIIFTIFFTFGICAKVTSLFFRLFSWVSRIPDTLTGLICISGLIILFIRIYRFLKANSPKSDTAR